MLHRLLKCCCVLEFTVQKQSVGRSHPGRVVKSQGTKPRSGRGEGGRSSPPNDNKKLLIHTITKSVLDTRQIEAGPPDASRWVSSSLPVSGLRSGLAPGTSRAWALGAGSAPRRIAAIPELYIAALTWRRWSAPHQESGGPAPPISGESGRAVCCKSSRGRPTSAPKCSLLTGAADTQGRGVTLSDNHTCHFV